MGRLVAVVAAWQLAPGPQTSAPSPPADPPVATASASEPSAAAALPRNRIVVGIDAGDASLDRDALTQVLAGHLADTGLRFRMASLTGEGDVQARLSWASSFAGERDLLAVFWIERHDEERSLYLFEPQRGTIWVRALPPASDPDELLESVGTMVRSIGVWLGDGAPPGMAAVEQEPPPPRPPAEPEPPRPAPTPRPAPMPPPPAPAFAWALGLAYAGGNLADVAPWQSGAGIGLDLEWRSRITSELAVAVLEPVTLRSLPAATVWRMPLSLAVGHRFRRGHALRPLVDAALVLEPLWWRAESSPAVVARSGRTLRIAVAPGVGLRWQLWGGLGVMLHARADLRVLDADLVVFQGGRRVSRLSPHPVAAFVRAGLWYAF